MVDYYIISEAEELNALMEKFDSFRIYLSKYQQAVLNALNEEPLVFFHNLRKESDIGFLTSDIDWDWDSQKNLEIIRKTYFPKIKFNYVEVKFLLRKKKIEKLNSINSSIY